MRSSETTADNSSILSYPGSWDEDNLRRNWIDHLDALTRESGNSIPLKRIQYQMEQNVLYQDTVRRWPKMNDKERFNAWKSLLEESERVVQEVLPTCVQCGECCRKGSPTLQLEDIEILREGKIPWHFLFSIRRGEPVRSPFEENLFFLLDERIKLREKDGTQECVLFDNETNECTVYADRPVQCRAQACWDPTLARQVAEQPYLTRRDIFNGVELLLDLISEHDQRCSFDKLNAAFKKLEETRGESIDEIIDLLAYEDHFRTFMGEKLNVPKNTLDLVFGRSFADLVPVFGFRVRQEPDGARCLVPDKE